jgi:uncharacterized protein YqiB (DUF1249 family)
VPFDLRALRVLRLFRLFRLLKLLRYSPALLTLKRVIAHEYRALLGALLPRQAAARSAMACCSLSSILSRKPVVESHA